MSAGEGEKERVLCLTAIVVTWVNKNIKIADSTSFFAAKFTTSS